MDAQQPTDGQADNQRSVSDALPDASTNGSSDRLATVIEAAEVLGITPDAVRSRLRRGTLKRAPVRGEEGEVLVVMPAPKSADQSRDKSGTVSDLSTDQSETVSNQSATDRDASQTVVLVEHMSSEINHLRGQLEEAHAANRENRRIIAALTQRVPELEAPREMRDVPETAAEGTDRGEVPPDPQEPAQPRERSWWRRFFGLD